MQWLIQRHGCQQHVFAMCGSVLPLDIRTLIVVSVGNSILHCVLAVMMVVITVLQK